MKILVSDNQIAFVKDRGVAVRVGNEMYYHLPFWYKVTDGDNEAAPHTVEEISFEKMPESLQNTIKSLREPKNDIK